MTARDYLMRISIMKEQIRQRTETIAEIRLQATGLTGQNGDGVRVATSNPDGDRMADAVARIVDLEKELAEEVVKLSRMQADAARRISAIPDPTLSRLLFERYVQGRPWKVIERELEISERHAPRVCGRAFAAFEELYAEELDLDPVKKDE